MAVCQARGRAYSLFFKDDRMANNQMIVRISVQMPKRRMVLLTALNAVDKIIQLKATQKLRELIIKRSIKVTPVKHEQSTTES